MDHMSNEREQLAKALYNEFGMDLTPANPARYWDYTAHGILRSKWLRDHDAKVKAEAWDEGASAAHDRLYARVGDDGLIDQHALIKFPDNPYRKPLDNPSNTP
jgi:hypothetical protein